MSSSKFIDPVLSSTIDFDNYIKHHLTTSSRERKTPRSNSDDAPIHRIHGRKTLDDDTTAANRIHNGKSRRDHQMVPMIDASLQASMLQVNACRYNLNSTGSSSRSEKKQQQQKDAKGRTSHSVSKNAVEPLVLQHSWRAYLKHDGRYGADSIARDDRTSKHLEVVPLPLPRPLMFDDDELTCDDLPRSHVPKPMRAIDNVILTGGSGKEDDGWAFSEYRVRLVSLKHFFNVWRVESARVHLLLYKRSAAVVAASRLHCLSLIMGYWRRYLQSGRFHCATLCRRGLSKLWTWRLRSRRYGRPQIDDGYYWVVQCRLSMRAFGYNRRMELDRQRRRALRLICVRHYQCNLAKTVFLGWKRYCSRARNEQMLRTEHSARQDKISSFMSSLRIQHGGISSISTSSSSNHRVVPPKAPPAGPRATTTSITTSSASYAPRTLKGDAVDKSISSSRHPPRRSDSSSSSKSSADASLSSPSRSDCSKAVQGRGAPVHVDDAPFRKLTSSDGDDARNTDMSSSYFTSDKAESKMRTCSSDVDVQSCSSDEDGDAASSVAVRAPSYDEVMKSANPKDALLLIRGEAAADHPPHPPHHPPSRLDAKNRELSMEERHRERKERVASLQRQAEERVSARNRERELNEKERDMRERDEAERLLRDRRRQLVEERAAKDRSAAAAVETMRVAALRADSFHCKQLCVRFGMAPWRRYMEQMRSHRIRAQRHFDGRLLQSTWSALLGYIVSLRTTRIRREHRLSSAASSHYAHQLLRRHWKVMKLHHFELKTKLKKLHHHYFSRANSLRRPFHGWKIAFEHAVRVAVRKYRSVIIPRGDRCIKRHCFQRWLIHRTRCLEEREVSHRINSKWLTVRGWLNS